MSDAIDTPAQSLTSVEQLEDEVHRLRYQIRLLAASSRNCSPLTTLVVEKNWGETDLQDAYAIFEKYAEQAANGTADWNQFEYEFCERFQISQQAVKSIILAFHRNGEWVGLCRKYALAKRSVEFREIFAAMAAEAK